MSLEQSCAWFCRRLPLVSEYLRMLAHLHFHIVQSSCIFPPAANALRLTARRCCWRGPTRLSSRTMTFAAVHESAGVQMLWGERRGHGTFGAVQRLPKEFPPCRNNVVILTRAGPSPPSSRIARSSP